MSFTIGEILESDLNNKKIKSFWENIRNYNISDEFINKYDYYLFYIEEFSLYDNYNFLHKYGLRKGKIREYQFLIHWWAGSNLIIKILGQPRARSFLEIFLDEHTQKRIIENGGIDELFSGNYTFLNDDNVLFFKDILESRDFWKYFSEEYPINFKLYKELEDKLFIKLMLKNEYIKDKKLLNVLKLMNL
ncbi:hypothetical protein Bp8pS_052 [Bacillus phage vB_BpuM-BpSp]|nr:hypothetical protein Bp8pS_052 [Bacillus phage vB_BpuM-BpSp]